MTLVDAAGALKKLVEAPEGPHLSRRLVLDLAIRGRLVPQDPADEPALDLLERIGRRRSGSAARGRDVRVTRTYTVHGGPVPFEVPHGWSWARLEDVFLKVTDGTHHSPPNGPAGLFRYVTAKDIKEDGVSSDQATYVSREVHEAIFARCDPDLGDILLVKDGATTGVVTVNDLVEPFSLLSSVALLKTGGLIEPWYACYAMRSPFFYKQTRGQMAGVGIPRVTLQKLNVALLPIPPGAEQTRIVARVRDLLTLIDRVEAAASSTEAVRVTARNTSLFALSTSETESERLDAWSRLSPRLKDLLTDPGDIGAFRDAVVDLATRGNLVRQRVHEQPTRATSGRKAGRGHDRNAEAVQQGWRIEPLGIQLRNVFTGPFGTSLKKSDYRPGGIPVINPQNLKDGVVVVTPTTCVGDETIQRLSSFRVNKGDVVLARRGVMGRCAVIGEREQGWLCGTGSMVLRPTPDVLPEYLALSLRSPRTVARLQGESVGSTMMNLNQRILLSLPFAVPPIEEQERIVAKVHELLTLLHELHQHMTTLRMLHSQVAHVWTSIAVA